jgi:hypothetical protein
MPLEEAAAAVAPCGEMGESILLIHESEEAQG